MQQRVAIIGAGVSGLTSGVILAEAGYRSAIFAEETGQRTTSAAAAALWYPYDAEPADKVIAWALQTYEMVSALSRQPNTGVSMIELRTYSRAGEIQIPEWAGALGAAPLFVASDSPDSGPTAVTTEPSDHRFSFAGGFALKVPLTDTTIYLDYLADRFRAAGGEIQPPCRLANVEDISSDFGLVVNCAGIGARELVDDRDLEAHRGQVVIVPKMDMSYAVVCDDPPLMYAIPRTNDCVFGGTNHVSDSLAPDRAATMRIRRECSRTLNIAEPKIIAERVGLRPFRKSGVRLAADRLRDGRALIHNYGHGGSGFTLSWGCAADVLWLARKIR
jgi:D-amino-acid oxidase